MRKTTHKVVAALAAQTRVALQCITPVEVLTTGAELEQTNSLIFVPHTKGTGNLLPLRRVDGAPALQLEVSLEYSVIFAPGSSDRDPFVANITRYIYGVADLYGRELFAFHWHPMGVSDVHAPHLHVSAAPSLRIPTGLDISPLVDFHLNKVHFPTHQIGVADFVGFLIRELGVAPRRTDWESVLDRVSQ